VFRNLQRELLNLVVLLLQRDASRTMKLKRMATEGQLKGLAIRSKKLRKQSQRSRLLLIERRGTLATSSSRMKKTSSYSKHQGKNELLNYVGLSTDNNFVL